MGNIKLSINLKKLINVGVMSVQGKNSKVKCLVIPIEANHIFISEKGAYLDILGFEPKNKSEKSETHLLKQSMPKDVYEKMTDADRAAQPLLGNATVYGAPAHSGSGGGAAAPATTSGTNFPDEDDLPF